MEFELTMQSETKQPKSKRSFRSHDHLTSFIFRRKFFYHVTVNRPNFEDIIVFWSCDQLGQAFQSISNNSTAEFAILSATCVTMFVIKSVTRNFQTQIMILIKSVWILNWRYINIDWWRTTLKSDFSLRERCLRSWPDDRLTYLHTGTMAEIYDCKIEKTFYSQRSRPTFLRWDPRNNHEVPHLMKH